MRSLVVPTRLPTALRVGALLGLTLLLGGCLVPPEPETTEAKNVFGLFVIVLIMAGIVFVGVEGFIIYSVFRYRRRDDRLPHQLHGNNLVEVIWTAIPTVIVLILFGLSMVTLSQIQARAAQPGVTVEVDGFQWQWTFHYLDGDSDPNNDYSVTGTAANPPVMGLPTGEPVRLILKSQDVIHSFYVPHFLIKRDVIPGKEPPNELEFTIDQPGTYAGQCAEFCGNAHADMTFSIQAMSRADYDAWLEAAKKGEPVPQPSGSGQPAGEVVKISADQLAFDTDRLEVPAGKPFVIEFQNKEAQPHNVAIFAGSEAKFEGEIITGPKTIQYQVPALDAGEYDFMCEVHPNMNGKLVAQ